MLTQEEAEKAGIIAVGSSIGRPDLKCPVVRFTPNEHARVAAPAKVWVPVLANRLENPNKTLLAERRQIPLVLAWWVFPPLGFIAAKLIPQGHDHAQGTGAEHGSCKDRCRQCLAARLVHLLCSAKHIGQLYVALSRATSLDGLELHNFDAKKWVHDATRTDGRVQANRSVIDWMKGKGLLP